MTDEQTNGCNQTADDTEQLAPAVAELQDQAVATGGQAVMYELTLYIAGSTPRSSQALKNVKLLCETELKGHYHLKVVDIYQQPDLAKTDQILAVPTLIKKLPEPLQIFIGDLSDQERVLVGLGLRAKSFAK